MPAVVFKPLPLPKPLAANLAERVGAAHVEEPFSPADARRAVERVVALLDGLGLPTTVYRGGLDLRGVEVDHVWVALGHDRDRPSSVLDVAFPLFDVAFVEILRRFVAGDARSDELEEAARGSGVDARVLGNFPAPMRYVGKPVWHRR